jgi:hypothetical protein
MYGGTLVDWRNIATDSPDRTWLRQVQGDNVKKLLSFATVATILASSALASAQYRIVKIYAVGTSNPQTFCSGSNVYSATAQWNSAQTELNISGTAQASSPGPLPANVTAIWQGLIYWTVQYTGASAPPTPTPVVIQANSLIEMGTSVSGETASATMTLTDPAIFPAACSGNSTLGTHGFKNVNSSVSAWTEVSPGVWQGNTGYYGVNNSLVGTTAGVAPDGAGAYVDQYISNIHVLSVNGTTPANN